MKVFKVTTFGKTTATESLLDVLSEVSELLLETTDPITIQTSEMTKKEFELLEEFKGY